GDGETGDGETGDGETGDGETGEGETGEGETGEGETGEGNAGGGSEPLICYDQAFGNKIGKHDSLELVLEEGKGGCAKSGQGNSYTYECIVSWAPNGSDAVVSIGYKEKGKEKVRYESFGISCGQ
ncbi:hypothetical protein, partial [Halomonas marinisediminis]|uniref:hypothetical protein n=1 Tax=Halomonas marinisediminis TaxID=2546095 RepID=UPI00197AB5AB